MASNGKNGGGYRANIEKGSVHQITGESSQPAQCSGFTIYSPVVVSIVLIAFTGASYYIVHS
jgi:hypothetical protein